MLETREERERYLEKLEEMQNTFSTVGWRYVLAEAQDEFERVKEQIVVAPSWDEARFLQGRADQLNSLIQLEYLVDAEASAYKESVDGGDSWQDPEEGFDADL